MIRRYVDIDTGRFFTRHEMDYPEPRRARRIRDLARMKAKARRVFANTALGDPALWASKQERDAYFERCERLANHLAHCNKRCCNRPRYWEGPTFQEKKANAV